MKNELKKLLENAGVIEADDGYNRYLTKAARDKEPESNIESSRRVRIEDIFSDIEQHMIKNKAITVKILDANGIFRYKITVDKPKQSFRTPVSSEQGRIDDYDK